MAGSHSSDIFGCYQQTIALHKSEEQTPHYLLCHELFYTNCRGRMRWITWSYMITIHAFQASLSYIFAIVSYIIIISSSNHAHRVLIEQPIGNIIWSDDGNGKLAPNAGPLFFIFLIFFINTNRKRGFICNKLFNLLDFGFFTFWFFIWKFKNFTVFFILFHYIFVENLSEQYYIVLHSFWVIFFVHRT